MEDILAFWNNFKSTIPDVGVKLLLAVILAGAIGFEREFRGRPAGLRTHILVCLGSTLMMIVSELIAKTHQQVGQDVWLDTGRIAAGIITGVGFLGAGTIITRSGEQQGLTTAATIWFMAAVGVAIGADYSSVAIVATVFALGVIIGLRHLERRMHQRLFFDLEVDTKGTPEDFEALEELFKEHRLFRVQTSRFKYDRSDGRIKTHFRVEARSSADLHTLLKVLQEKYPQSDTIVIEH